MFKVAEKFVSINGESRRAGELAVFIRFGGCNLSCTYCDTAWAIPLDAPLADTGALKDGETSSSYEMLSGQDIVDYIRDTGVDNVTLTGGEPLLQLKEYKKQTGQTGECLEDLVVDIISLNKRVEIETNGAVSIEPLFELAEKLSLRDELSITLDYKCPGSGMESFMLMDNYKYLREYDAVKFVVMNREDLDRAREVIMRYQLVERGIGVYLSPVFGEIEPREIVEYMIEHGMNGVTNQLQQHKFIWPPDARGV
ncbi:7-carboxy-7-deazaguanine synthase [Lachnospiraceae bacterium NE2001]|nr:7-carboxy-7-deazaguanine synthase [Lachnospiraceae bacterium NE2001]